MAVIRWSKEFEIGIADFDNEHRELFIALSDLREAAETGDHVRAERVLNLIGDHATDHFRHEEERMRRAKYSGLNWHKQQHETATKRLLPLLQDARRDVRVGAERLIAFLGEWLGDHIAVNDRMMAASVRNAERMLRVPRRRRAA
jgi:hemerythrin